MNNPSVKAVIHSLISMIDEGSIHLDDRIIDASILETALGDGKVVYDDGTGEPAKPNGCLNLLIRSWDPDATEDTDLYIYQKNKEETEE